MPKMWSSKTILAKIETTYGVDPVPTGAANAILAMDVSFNPQEAEIAKRNLERPYFGAEPFVATGFRSTLSFSVELVGSGSLGVAPGWGVLLRACAAAQVITASTKVEYTPITDNRESVALYFDVDGTLYKMLGAVGTAVMGMSVNENPAIKFTFTSLYTAPAEAAKPTPVFTAFQPPQAVNNANSPAITIGGTNFVARDFELDLGGKVEPRFMWGQETIMITDRDETAKITVEAISVATYNPATIAALATQQAIVVQHGTIVGRKVRFDLPFAQQMPLSSVQQTQNVAEWPLQFAVLPSTGNDQWKITLT